MPWIMVDIEADGPIPSDYSMIALGAIVVEPALDRCFTAKLRPIAERFVPAALAVSGFSREQTLAFPDPAQTMDAFVRWLAGLGGTPRFVSDNNGFDWQFVNWYLHHFVGNNPFGHSSTNLGSLYKGLVRDTGASFKHLRRTAHTHDPLDDARGNAEAMLALPGLGLKLRFDR
ncbi:MAG: exonuclease [Nannocystaceae bacterium]|nr:exonuclease [Nannocystaceae bacterium]